MANWQQTQQPTNNLDDRYREIANMMTVSKADPQTALGYALGRYLGNYIQRGQTNDQRNKLDSSAVTEGNVDSALAKNYRANSQLDNSTAVDANSIGTFNNSSGDSMDAAMNNYQQQRLQPNLLTPQPDNSQSASPAVDLLGPSLGGSQSQSGVQQNQAGSGGSAFDNYLKTQGLNASNVSQQMANSAQNIPQSSMQSDQQSLMDQTQYQTQQAAQQYQGQQQKINDIAKLASIASFGQAATDNSRLAANQLDFVGRNLAGKLIAAKQAYANAQQFYDNAKTDEDKNKAIAVMGQSSTAADSIRQSAQAAGIDLSQYGAGTTLQQAAQNLQNDFYTGVRNILGNDLSSDEYYTQVFNQVKKNGGTDNQARQLAGEKASVYQSQRLSRLSNAFENYGLNQSGSVNNIGAQILMQMQQENPNQANGYANMYATPKDDYSFNNDITKLDRQYTDALHSNLTLNNQKYELEDKTRNNDLQRNIKLERFKSDLSTQQKAYLYKMEVASKDMETTQKFSTLYHTALSVNMSPEKAAAYALAGVGGEAAAKAAGIGGGKSASVTESDQYKAAKDTIKLIQEEHKDDTDDNWKQDPTYVSALGTVENAAEPQYDLNNYADAMKSATDMIYSSKMKGYTKKQAIDGINKKYGDFADSIINSTDWDSWGFN